MEKKPSEELQSILEFEHGYTIHPTQDYIYCRKEKPGGSPERSRVFIDKTTQRCNISALNPKRESWTIEGIGLNTVPMHVILAIAAKAEEAIK